MEDKLKEEQIEEMANMMAKDVCPNVMTEYCASGKCKQLWMCNINQEAFKILVEQGWVKNNKDSIVLSREEFENNLTLSMGYKIGSKETAEKFAKEIIDKFNCGKLSIEDDEDIEIHLTASELFELAKQFGVEIK